ncbi:TIGR03364 family FAD-dependent oxidoreductase [Actinokineospora sp. UTMC 2448]|uniref:TIGR03364 family FAD-dependent oxidoreductase n=1 Tax=Actinokineospora sp. UTMC 2448 TaxID=2268449 RepID=UPI0021640D44|nr:TIGR03364 family FAD-dependent oxidoreductase [Actinokineospora sp. UTMC 2448]UVS79649.1 Gamma-glutamylputrescine oxidoreductase [Actinokineospora sp. UTMC 2448]
MKPTLVIVGAGIVGLAHAVDGVRRGMRVVVLDRDERAVGASVRNFGHICVTAQDGPALDLALAARRTWLRLAGEAGFRLAESGTLVLARADDELAVLAEFAGRRGEDQVRLLRRDELAFPLLADDVLGGALLPLDLRVDPREAVRAIAAWLAARGVQFRWRTAVTGVEPGVVRTTRGALGADAVIVAVGHDVDRLLPDLADEAGVRRCRLRMFEVAAPNGATVGPAVLSGLSMVRYAGLAGTPSAAHVRDRISRERPELLDVGMNLMLTQRPGGELVVGDTHHYATTLDPFLDEDTDALVLREAARLLGVRSLAVRRRWSGVYASAPTDFLVAAPHPATRVVAVTSGIGMTTAFGLAPTVLDDLAGDHR